MLNQPDDFESTSSLCPLGHAVLVPAHNESRTIAMIVKESIAHSKLVVVVDDGSVDGTGNLAADAGALVLRNDERRGLGESLRLGLLYLKNAGICTVVTLDGDGVHDPSYIPSLLQSHFAADAEFTIGTRFAAGAVLESIPTAKVAANHFATVLINRVLGCKCSDVASGMRVFSGDALDLHLTSTDFAISFEFIAAALRAGLVINEHPIRVRYDAEDMFCTGRGELLNLLTFATNCTPGHSVLRQNLMQLQDLVENFRRIRIRANGTPILLHPVREYEAYAFQIQHEWYLDKLEGEQWLEIG